MRQFERGTMVGERYRLVDEIGRGGMGSVWCAFDEVLDRLVAVKLMPEGSGQLRQEARAAARLTHPHITSVYDYGGPPQSPVAYIVMELLQGESLANRLAAGPVAYAEAVTVGAQVASALAAAHRRGVVHRDVTPGNIVLTADGAKVVDFGISTIGQVDTPTTYGTPRYLAPELLVGGPATPASDVYAFGVVLHELLPPAGTPSSNEGHPHSNDLDEGAPHSNRGGPDARSESAELGELGELTAWCRAEDPAERPAMDEVAELLHNWSVLTSGNRLTQGPNVGFEDGGPTGTGRRGAHSPTGVQDAGGRATVRVRGQTRTLTGALAAARGARARSGTSGSGTSGPGTSGSGTSGSGTSGSGTARTGPARTSAVYGRPPARLSFLLAGTIGLVVILLLMVATAGDPPGDVRPGPTAATTSGGDLPRIRMQVRAGNLHGQPNDQQVAARFNLMHLASSEDAVELSRVQLRYWFTDDGPDDFQVACDWAEVGSENVRARVETLTDPTDGADHVLVVNFADAAGWISPGQETGEIQLRFNKQDWSVMDETDDHSYLPTAEPAAARNVTAYVDGRLVWGTEP